MIISDKICIDICTWRWHDISDIYRAAEKYHMIYQKLSGGSRKSGSDRTKTDEHHDWAVHIMFYLPARLQVALRNNETPSRPMSCVGATRIATATAARWKGRRRLRWQVPGKERRVWVILMSGRKRSTARKESWSVVLERGKVKELVAIRRVTGKMLLLGGAAKVSCC